MAKFMDKCFNPSNLQFFVHNEFAAKGYEILTEDYTKDYFKIVFASDLELLSCRFPAAYD